MAKKIDLYDGGTGQRTPGRPHPAGHLVVPHPEKINVDADAPRINRGDNIGRGYEDNEFGYGKDFDAKPTPGVYKVHDVGGGANKAGTQRVKPGASMGTADGQHRCNQGPMMNSGQRSGTIAAARIGHLSGGETHDRVPAAAIDADVEPEYQPMASKTVDGSGGDKTP